MAYQVLLDADYTFDASEKTVTLLGDYATLELPQIKSIRNITKGRMVIYDCDNPDTAVTYTTPVITWTPEFAYMGTTFADTDELQIIIDTASINTTTPLNVLVDDSTPIDVNITNTTISATDHVILTADDTGIIAGGVAISTINTPLSVLAYSQLHMFVGNTGQSTSVTITCRGKPTAASTMWEDLAVITLGVSPSNKAGTCIVDFPAYVYFDITNNDTGNGAAIALTVQGK